jgi:hypothetical protein
MNDSPQITNEHILYAQALQIAILMSEPPSLPASMPNNMTVEKNIDRYHDLAKSVLLVLRRRKA